MNKNRNLNLDLMRLIGVIIIMIAHASPPEVLHQLRNFGTPLLIVASALTYAVIYSNKNISILPFYTKRLTRLMIPAWIFLSFFFLALLIPFTYTGKDYPFSLITIFTSYTFYGGIGFVWVLKIYIVLALFTPIALKTSKSNLTNNQYFSILVLLYIMYEFLVYFSKEYIPNSSSEFFDRVVFIIPPYLLLYLYGMRLSKITKKSIKLVILISFIIFASFLILKYIENDAFVPTQGYKYPPTLYYLSYAFFALNSIYILCHRLPNPTPKLAKIISWLSSNSLWIYLWHIMAFYLWKFVIDVEGTMFSLFILKVIFLLSIRTLLTLAQVTAVNKISQRNSFFKKHISHFLK